MTDDHPLAGWYDDPEDPGRYRYWDGGAWTEHRSPKTAAPPSPAGPYRESTAPWALGLSVCGLFCCGLASLVGFILGIRELQAARDGAISPQDRGFALAATIIGGIVTAIMVVFFVIFVLYVLTAGDPAPT